MGDPARGVLADGIGVPIPVGVSLGVRIGSVRGHPPGLTAAPSQAWRRYDTDRSGYIEANELKVGCERGAGEGTSPLSLGGVTTSGTARSLSPQGFLSDLLKKANRPYDEPKLQEYTQTIVGGSWSRGDTPSPALQGLGGAQSHRCPPFGVPGQQGVTGGRFVSCSCGCST